MKLFKQSEIQVNNEHNLGIFLNFVKKNQIRWTQNDFEYIGSGSLAGQKFEYVYKKEIKGLTKRQSVAGWDFAFILYGGHNEDSANNVFYLIELKARVKDSTIAKWQNIPSARIDEFFGKFNIVLKDKIENVDGRLEEAMSKSEEEFDGKKTYHKRRLTKSKDAKWAPTEVTSLLRIKSERNKKFLPTLYFRNFEKSDSGKEGSALGFLNMEEPEEGMSFFKAKEVLKTIEDQLINNIGFVDGNSQFAIPTDATPLNYDFYLNKPKGKKEDDEDEDWFLKGSKLENFRIVYAQDYEGYFSGEVPDYAANLVGTSSVDASQVQSSFGKASEAINLVNQFDASFLRNIAYIFDFDQGGAYGVYIPKLDEAIKTKALKNELENRGYSVVEEGGSLVAYHDEKDQADIQAEIDSIYNPLAQQGGHVISVNTSKILGDARQDAQNVMPLVEQVWTEQEAWENFSILHLGETIVHEATHAHGYEDEGKPTEEQKRFVDFALEKMNQKLQSDMNAANLAEQFEPLPPMTSSRTAKSYSKMMKISSAYVPQELVNRPMGSDLSGRYMGLNDRKNPQSGAFNHLQSNGPIEKKLGRDFMAPLPPDLSQEHDHIDLQLRKYHAGEEQNDPRHSTERLLSEFHGSSDTYELIEELLERERPSPLMLPINKKDASSSKGLNKRASLTKEATLFGWYNNLEISDGSTIPGLGDRVMAWDDRDESFSEEEDWIKSQPRYNPTGYTAKGFWYEWVEPRFKPTLWDDAVSQNLGSIHPAKRFASDRSELTKIITIIGLAKKDIESKKIKATRFIVSEDIFPYIEKLCKDRPSTFFEMDCFANKIPNNENVLAFWLVDDDVLETDVQIAEDFMQGKNEEGYACVENLLQRNYEEDVHKIIDEGIKICKKNSIDIQVVGESARKIKQDDFNLECIDFCGTVDETMKFCSLLADELGVANIGYKCNNRIAYFFYKGVNLTFNIGFYPEVFLSTKRMANFSNVHKDLFNRDFKINMVGYSLLTGQLNNPLKVNVDSNILETLFDPAKVLNKNPLIMLRALTFCLEEGFVLGDDLKKEILRRGQVYVNKCDPKKLEYYRERMKFCGNKKMKKFLDSLYLDLEPIILDF